MSSATETNSIVVRDIEGIAEIRAVEDLQIEAWGDDPRDIVPLSQLAAAMYVGGSLIGAFDGEKMVGFAYGFYGHLQGHIVHHSHMLAVLAAYRNHNLAFRLKLAQREQVLADGLTDRMTWTFDPLQSLNAYFNFAKLGVISDTYKENVYGESGTSFLHRNGTDRLFVMWLVDSPRVQERITCPPVHWRNPDSPRTALPLLTMSNSGLPERFTDSILLSEADYVSIEIPADINSVEQANFDAARRWRKETRYIFSEALASGFVVTDYFLKNEQTGIYLLQKNSSKNFVMGEIK